MNRVRTIFWTSDLEEVLVHLKQKPENGNQQTVIGIM